MRENANADAAVTAMDESGAVFIVGFESFCWRGLLKGKGGRDDVSLCESV